MQSSTSVPPSGNTHHQAHKTRQVGRIRAQFVLSGDSLRNIGTAGRLGIGAKNRPVRSLSIALLLAAATMAGVGVAAWAMGSTPVPAVGVRGDGGSPVNGPVNGRPSGELGDVRSLAARQSTDGQTTDGQSTSGESTGGPGETSAAQARNSLLDALLPSATGLARDPSSYDQPAIISTLAPGDPGFGWPDQQVSPST